MTKKKFVSWRRVSTEKQNASGLGLEAQKNIIDHFVESENGVLIADFCECYTGKDLEGCTELQKAMRMCKENSATLIIAKTDRFRNVIEALTIYEKMGGNIYFCDLPHSDKFTLTLFFALAEREALLVSIRTKQALAAKKAQGHKLGRPKKCKTDEATTASVSKRKKEAAEKPCNKAIWSVVKKCTDNFTKLTTPNFADAAIMLQQMGIFSSTGQVLTKERVRSAYYNLRKVYGEELYFRRDSADYRLLSEQGYTDAEIRKMYRDKNKEIRNNNKEKEA